MGIYFAVLGALALIGIVAVDRAFRDPAGGDRGLVLAWLVLMVSAGGAFVGLALF